MFTDDFIRYTEIFIGVQKSDWFQCLKQFYDLTKTRTQLAQPIECFQSDYSSKLQSKQVRKQISKKEITFEPSTSYSQEQNRVSKRVGHIIMDMTSAIILDENIDNNL